MSGDVVREVLPFILGSIAFAFIGLGLYGLIHKRPFLVHSRWMLILLLACFSPSLVTQTALLLDTRGHGVPGPLRLMSLVAAATFIVVLVFMAMTIRGYLVFSATQSSFREGVLAGLTRLGIPFEETLSSIRLPTVPAELHVAVQGWVGTGQLRLKRGSGTFALRELAGAMTAQFESRPTETNRTWAIVYVVLGILMGLIVVARSST